MAVQLLRASSGGGTATAARALPNGIAFVGDSLTNFWYPNPQMWHNALCALSGGYIRHRGKFALGGRTLADMEATYLPAALALNPKPGAVVLAGGTNDHAAPGYSFATSAATLNRMITTCLNAGVLPILFLVPPRQDSTTNNGRVGPWNAYVRQLAVTLGLPYFDFHTPITDPATGQTAAPYVGDTVHPNIIGHQVAAAWNLARPEFLARITDGTPHLVHDAVDPSNLIGSGIGLFLSMSGSWPVGITGSGPITASLVADSQAAGNWLRLARLNGATGTGSVSPSSLPAAAPGDKIAVACRFRHTYPIAPTASTTPGVNVVLSALDSANANLASTSIYGPYYGGPYTGVAYGEVVLPANTAKVKPEVRIVGTTNADAVVDIAQLTVLNLTALGMAGLTTTDVL